MPLPRYFEPGVAVLRDKIATVEAASLAATTRSLLAELNRLLWATVPTPALKEALEGVRVRFLQLAAALCGGEGDPWIERQNAQQAVDRLALILSTTQPNELTKVLHAA